MSRCAALLIAAAVAALALSGPALALDPADHSADLDAAAERNAAAAALLAALANPAPPSLTIAGGRVTVAPNRTITIEAPTTITLGSGIDAAALAYLATLAARDAPAGAE